MTAFSNTLRQSPAQAMALGLGTRVSAIPSQDQQGQVQPTGMEGIALERKVRIILCLQVVTQCDFQVLAQEISLHFLWSRSTPWKRNLGGITRLGFISPNFRHPRFVCLCVTQSSGILAIGERNSCSSGVIHPPALA